MTLVELVLALSLSFSIITLVVTAYLVGLRVFQEKVANLETFQEGSRGMEWFIRDIRQSRQVISAEAQSVSLWLMDADSDQIMDPDELVTYGRQGDKLMRSTLADSQLIAAQITSLAFSYSPLVNPTLVSLNLQITTDYGVNTWEAQARLRNYP
jgi:hypothetical protein